MPHSKRRGFLKSATAALALPMLEQHTHAGEKQSENRNRPKRFVAIGTNLGYHAKAFFPADTGRNYQTSELLQHLDQHRNDYTVLSGFDHRSANGHKNWDNFLCGKRVGAHSLDQQIADHLAAETQYPSIQLCAGEIPKQRMCFDKHETPLPMLNRPSAIYTKLFGGTSDRERTEFVLRSGRSAMDSLREEARLLQLGLGAEDNRKLDQYFQSLRELEVRMGRQLELLDGKRAQVDYDLPDYDPVAPTLMLECEQIMLDMIHLALQTDATRVATLFIAGLGQVFTLDGRTLRAGYHALSHHGNDPDLIRDLVRVETEHIRCFARFLSNLKESKDSEGRPLLDSTVVLIGTGMGDASRHSNRNLPTLVAGAGLGHGCHVSATQKSGAENPARAKPGDELLLGDVYLSIMQRFGMEVDSFSGAKHGISAWS
ncbi:MAG: DUF1552 domain-containing protein [Planctomycetota bacterium]